VSEIISFDRNDRKHWTYQGGRGSMADVQAEGTAHLWNRISEPAGFALLADEVGLGKTMQALAVCALLWNHKPFARILVIAPRAPVADLWETEYATFIAEHYKVDDDVVRTSLSGEPVHACQQASDLFELCRQVNEQRTAHLHVAKTTSFSYLTGRFAETEDGKTLTRSDQAAKRLQQFAGIDEDFARASIDAVCDHWPNDDRAVQAGVIASALRDWLIHRQGGFDLLIIDEAHYYRTVGGGSQKVAAAREFFGESTRYRKRIAGKVLLLTATPNHRSPADVANIVSYFRRDPFEGSDDAEVARMIMQSVGLRRLRQLAGRTKYQYREEIPDVAHLSDDTAADLFFGWYQRQLVRHVIAKAGDGQQSVGLREGGQLVFGYMEGFEFFPAPRTKDPAQSRQDEEDSQLEETPYGDVRDDYEAGQAADSGVLQQLCRRYISIVGESPRHPKYEQAVERLLPTDSDALYAPGEPGERKALIFVRRIASAGEIERRVNERMDGLMAHRLARLTGTRVEGVQALCESGLPDDDADLLEVDPEQMDEGDPGSAPRPDAQPVWAAFQRRGTAAAKVRDYFRLPRHVLSLFFELPPDPADIHGYHEGFSLPLLVRQEQNRPRRLYRDSVRKLRSDRYEDQPPGVASLLISHLGDPHAESSGPTLNGMHTIWTLYWKALASHPDPALCAAVTKAWDRLGPIEREGLADFLSVAVRLASPSMVELFGRYLTAFSGARDAEGRYAAFARSMGEGMAESWLFQEITHTLLNFQIFIRKIHPVSGQSDTRMDLHEQWKAIRNWVLLFRNANPGYGYTARTRNDAVRTRFNTVFFPYFLASTSVLQEGVNLQYFCSRVVHYGIARSPGDNEQRVGRIDRRFGLLERQLETGRGRSRLEIRIPIVSGTLDDQQAVSFLQELRRAEKDMDRCLQTGGQDTMNLTLPVRLRIEQLCRKPQSGLDENRSPYPVSQALFERSGTWKELRKAPSPMGDVVRRLVGDLRRNIPTEWVFTVADRQSTIAIVNVPQLRGMRDQPIIASLRYWSEMSNRVGEVMYRLELRTPLFDQSEWIDHVVGPPANMAARQEVLATISRVLEYNPLVQLVREDNDVGKFHVHARVSLPLFRSNNQERHLHAQEIVVGRDSLAAATDEIEREVLQKDYDWSAFRQKYEQGEAWRSEPQETWPATHSQPRWDSIGPGWTAFEGAGRHYFVREAQTDDGAAATWEEACARMTKFPGVQWLPRTSDGQSGLVRRVAWPRLDFQREEKALLEDWAALADRACG
jgi:hypothetical protein